MRGTARTTTTDVVRISSTLSATPLPVAVLLALGLLLARWARRKAAFLLLASPGIVVLIVRIKQLVQRPQPPGVHPGRV